MKRLAAILIAALITMTVSLPVFAEPDESSADETVQSSVTDEESTEQSDSDDTSSDENNQETSESTPSGDESKSDNTSSQDSDTYSQDSDTSDNTQESTEKSAASETKLTEYRIDAGNMTIGIPSDMYVITRDTDKDDPVLAVNKMTKEEIMKRFEENDIYLRANTRDFACVINVTVSETVDTNTIGNLSNLSEENLQSIVDKLLASDIYTSCSKQTYNGVLFLAFTIEYENNGTMTQGIQQYTIVNGKNIKITYQSAAEGNAPNKSLFTGIMKTVSFDSIETPSEPQTSQSINFSEIDIRYIYIVAASVIGIIALIVMIVTGVKYSRSKKEQKAQQKEKAASKKNKNQEKNNSPKDIFSDTTKEKKKSQSSAKKKNVSKQTADQPTSYNSDTKQNVNDLTDSEKTIELEALADYQEIKAKPMTYDAVMEEFSSSKADKNGYYTADDIPSGGYVPNDLLSTSSDSDSSSGNYQTNSEKSEFLSKDKFDKTTDNNEEIIFAESSEKRRTEIEQIGNGAIKNTAPPTTESQQLSAYEKRFGKNKNAIGNAKKSLDVTVIDAHDNDGSKFEKYFGKPAPATQTSTKAGTISSPSSSEQNLSDESAFFSKFIEKLKNTNEEIAPAIAEIERKESGASILTKNTSDTAEKAPKKSGSIELEILRAADGGLIIGATNEINGKPIDIEIRDASHYREEEDKKLEELGFETVRQNEIYNAHTVESEEKPFIVRAKSETGSATNSPSEQSSNSDKNKKEQSSDPTSKAASNKTTTNKSDKLAASKNTKGSKTSLTDTNVKTDVDAAAASNEQPKEETENMEKDLTFERETGIIFERPLAKQSPIVPMQTSFTHIPRLESVNADEYNKQYEEMKRSMPKNHAYAQRFSNSGFSQPPAEAAKPINNPEPTKEPVETPTEDVKKPEEDQKAAVQNSETLEFYKGYEEGDNPFSEFPDGEAVVIKDHKKKNTEPMGKRLKKSFGKLFASDEADEEDEE